MTRLERLDAVMELLSDERRWTQRVSARNADGYQTEALSDNASQWCPDGAYQKVSSTSFTSFHNEFPEVAGLLDARGFDGNYVQFNDVPYRTHAEVMAFLGELRAAVATSDGEAA